MKTILLATTLMLTPAANAAPVCFAWVMKGNDLTCELRGPNDNRGHADGTAREAQEKNNRGNTYDSTTTTTNPDGSKTSTTTTTTFPRGWPYSR